MKVLHVFNEIKFSGGEIMYVNAAPLFQKSGIQLLALSTGDTEGAYSSEFKKAGIKVIHKPLPGNAKNPLFLYKYFKDVFAFIKQEKIDVVHIHRASYYWYFALVAKLAKVKAVRTVHNVFKNRSITLPKAIIERYTSRKLFNLKFQSIGPSVEANELNYYKNPTIRINNWFDNKKFYPVVSNEERNNTRDALGISRNEFVIISIGGCSPIKNHHDIIRAIPLILAACENITYLHLGCGQTEAEEKKLAEELGITGKVRFAGNKTNVRDYLIASDLYVMPSKFEGLGNAAVEAMACGLPSVLYNVPGLKDLIHNNDNGYLIEPDYKLLAEKIIELINHPGTGKQMGKNAQAYVNNEFSIAKSVKQIIGLYE